MSGRLRIALLGATGSIGSQALDVIDRNPGRFEVFGLVSGTTSMRRQARYSILASDPDADARIEEMVSHPDCDLVLVAIPGARALAPSLTALAAHKKLAIATKEVLVMAGAEVMKLAGRDGVRPVDSEHSAIWQCLWGEDRESIQRLLLTASGGPFWAQPDLDLDRVTLEQALAHPRWSMGPKVSIDSATLMNKGLELIEAHHLFGVDLDRIGVLVHPQSIVHSIVQFRDGSAKAQLGNPDMRVPIAVALAYPERLADAVPPTDFERLGRLDFEPLDGGRFRSVELAREAARKGSAYPAVLNAANEVAVAGFINGRLRFGGIVDCVEGVLGAFQGSGESLPEILDADRWAREYATAKLGKVFP